MKSYQTELHSAWLVGEINPKEIEALAAAGIEAVESHATQISIEQAREARRICDANGIKIHSVMRGANFNRDDLYKSDVEAMIRAIRVAAAYGASSILCVPGRVDAPPVSPDKFKIQFDPETLELKSLTENDGDSPEIAKYIAAQNYATQATRERLPQVFKVAAYEGVRIGLENVWNNLWCAPEFYAAFVHSFDSPWVGSYFDLGNHVKYAPTEKWLRALGKNTIVKMHFKAFLYDASTPSLGHFTPIGTGSNDWKLIRDVMEEIEYNGFLTMEFEEGESRKLTLQQQVQKFKNFFAGEDILKGV